MEIKTHRIKREKKITPIPLGVKLGRGGIQDTYFLPSESRYFLLSWALFIHKFFPYKSKSCRLIFKKWTFLKNSNKNTLNRKNLPRPPHSILGAAGVQNVYFWHSESRYFLLNWTLYILTFSLVNQKVVIQSSKSWHFWKIDIIAHRLIKIIPHPPTPSPHGGKLGGPKRQGCVKIYLFTR